MTQQRASPEFHATTAGTSWLSFFPFFLSLALALSLGRAATAGTTHDTTVTTHLPTTQDPHGSNKSADEEAKKGRCHPKLYRGQGCQGSVHDSLRGASWQRANPLVIPLTSLQTQSAGRLLASSLASGSLPIQPWQGWAMLGSLGFYNIL